MKSKLFLETIRTIKRSIGKYINLLVIVLLGVSFFAGMLSISPAMGQSVDKYIEDYKFFDFQIYSNYGFDQEDIEAIKIANSKNIVEGAKTLDAEGVFGETNYIFRVESFDEENQLNLLNLVEGRLPTKPGEALAEIPSDLYEVPQIGESVKLIRGTENPEEILSVTEFEIVGFVTTPNYMSQEKGTSFLDNLTLNSFLYIPEETFTTDYYSTIYIQNKEGVPLDFFGKEYEEKMKEEEESLQSIAKNQEGKRAEKIQNEANEEYEKALEEYNQGISQLSIEREKAEGDIDLGYEEINKGLGEIEKGINDLREAIRQLELLLEGATPEEKNQILAQKSQIESSILELKSQSTQLVKEKEVLKEEEEKAKAAFLEAETELAKAEEELSQGKKEIEGMEEGEWTILGRDEHYSMSTYTDTVKQMQVIGLIFPIFFFMVAALVCLTTMTRMVDEQRGQIGIFRALGYSRWACASKYLIYALSATLIGGVLGAVIGVVLFPPIVFNTWGIVYNLPEMEYGIPWLNMAISIGIFVVVIGLTTYSAIRYETSEVASNLMRPKSPPAGKKTFIEKITFLWKKFSFTNKVTARNIIRYKKRFFMTIIGISGCTCLLISGFGMRDSISNIDKLQFQELTQYTAGITVAEGTSKETLSDIGEKINELDGNSKSTLLTSYGSEITSHGQEAIGYVQVYENDQALKNMNVARERISKEELYLEDDSVLISEKISELLEIEVGDEIEIQSQNEEKEVAVVGGIYEKYINHEIYISDRYYEKIFGEVPEKNTFHIKSDLDEEKLQEAILNLQNVKGITFNSSIVSSFTSITGSMDIVVIVIIISAAALAFVVLGNLANINISERKREIATLKVLGFNHKETKAYIFKESIVLTVIGSLVGIVFGIFAHNFIIRQVEMDFIMFVRSVSFQSIVYSLILTFVFSIFVNKFMLSKLKKINMIESLKSVE